MCAVVLGVTTANAQFEKGARTLSGNVTGLGFGFTKNSDGGGLDDQISFGLQAKGSYFIIDKLALVAGVGFDYIKLKDTDAENAFNFEVGGRYYFWDKLYGGVSYMGEKWTDYDYVSYAKVGMGATLYIKDNVFFEPELYFKQGIGDVDIYSSLGISVGIGVNF